jgi:hypothetical protein
MVRLPNDGGWAVHTQTHLAFQTLDMAGENR